MGVWCSEGCNRKSKEISAEAKVKGPASSALYKKSDFLAQERQGSVKVFQV
jgi:hypothetical protein